MSHLLSYTISKDFSNERFQHFAWRSRWTLNLNFLFYCPCIIFSFSCPVLAGALSLSLSLSLSLCIFPPYMICARQAQQNLLPSQHCHKHCYIYLTLSILSFSNLQPLLPFLFRRMVDSAVFLTFFSFIITAERLKNSFFQINICYISCNFTRVLFDVCITYFVLVLNAFHIQKLRNKEF